MHTVAKPGAAQDAAVAAGAVARVAVAGATGYTGQELLRLLARHPAVRLTLATSSGAASSARRLPALARLWDGAITPLEPDALKREADLVFLALPDMAAAEIAPTLVDEGVRVIDLSGAFRLRDQAVRARWYPESSRLPAERGVWTHRASSARPSGTRGWWPIRAVTQPRRFCRWRRWPPPASSCLART